MIIRRHPKRAAGLMMTIGMSFLIAAAVWTRVVAHMPAPQARWADFTTGVVYGVSIGANLVSVILFARR